MLGDLDADIFLGLGGGGAEVRGEGDVLAEAEERVVGGGRLVFVDIEGATGDVAGVDGGLRGPSSSMRPPRAQLTTGRAVFMQGEAVGVENVVGVLGERHVQGDDVGTGEGGVGRSRRVRP